MSMKYKPELKRDNGLDEYTPPCCLRNEPHIHIFSENVIDTKLNYLYLESHRF
jgi:hypothetical protein